MVVGKVALEAGEGAVSPTVGGARFLLRRNDIVGGEDAPPLRHLPGAACGGVGAGAEDGTQVAVAAAGRQSAIPACRGLRGLHIVPYQRRAHPRQRGIEAQRGGLRRGEGAGEAFGLAAQRPIPGVCRAIGGASTPVTGSRYPVIGAPTPVVILSRRRRISLRPGSGGAGNAGGDISHDQRLQRGDARLKGRRVNVIRVKQAEGVAVRDEGDAGGGQVPVQRAETHRITSIMPGYCIEGTGCTMVKGVR